jgi:hypothetical protein
LFQAKPQSSFDVFKIQPFAQQADQPLPLRLVADFQQALAGLVLLQCLIHRPTDAAWRRAGFSLLTARLLALLQTGNTCAHQVAAGGIGNWAGMSWNEALRR